MRLIHGDCLDVLRTLADNSVDSVVTDPPYGLSFMGKKWDYDVPAVEVWAQCLRVLKPGGHLLAFAGTRTQHRMAVRIEDAGFEIRDMIAWIYGSGFPKSLDVGKAIDREAGAVRDRVMVPTKPANHPNQAGDIALGATGMRDISAPATDAARQWQGWGTALKPALETVTVASKPFPFDAERATILSNLSTLEARLWLLSFASVADQASPSSQSEYAEACAIARWTADDVTNTRGDLCAQMDTSLYVSALSISLSIVSSWRHILGEVWRHGSTSTTETKSSMTIDLSTLRFSLSEITPSTIIRACALPGGFNANASIAERFFSASLSLLQSIHTLSATAPAMSLEHHERRAVPVSPNLDPCIMARKPLSGTVAGNVTTWGTGGINVDGCRVGTSGGGTQCNNRDDDGKCRGHDNARRSTSGETFHGPDTQGGRWPANLIHDGSDEVVRLFPHSTSGANPTSRSGIGYMSSAKGQESCDAPRGQDSGSAARFFYCPKTSKADREQGCAHLEARSAGEVTDRDEGSAGIDSPRAGAGRGREETRNHHPTVKPTDLMRYLCRLVTPPGGTVLDPYMGSGSTGKAAALGSFDFVGIEREAEYLTIARARIGHVEPIDDEPTEARQPDAGQMTLF